MDPLVSIEIVTYNHEDYIGDALDGILMQKTNFPFEIVIGEDCSTDKTLEIVLGYARKFPEIITVLTTDKNLGALDNSIRTIKACRGKYLALLEGDDYWTDPTKLQKQVDFLEANPEYIAYIHNSKCYYETTEDFKENVYSDDHPGELTLKDLAAGYFLKTCALLFRNDPVLIHPLLEKKLFFDDRTLGFCLLKNGNKAYYSNESMAVYRIHPNGTWSMINPVQRLDYDINNILMYYDYYNDDIIKPQLKAQLLNILRVKLRYNLKRGRIVMSANTLAKYFRYLIK